MADIIEVVRDQPHVYVARLKTEPVTYVKRWKPFDEVTNPNGMPFVDYWADRESALITHLNSSNIPHVVQYNGIDKAKYEITTIDAGFSLDQWRKFSVRMDGNDYPSPFWRADEFLKLLRWCLTALKGIHQAGFVHCDIKEDNFCVPEVKGTNGVFLDYSKLAIIDFAFSTAKHNPLRRWVPIDYQHKKSEYLSPELRRALQTDQRRQQPGEMEKVSYLSDLYSLNYMAWRYFTKGLAYPADRSLKAGDVEKLLETLDSFDSSVSPEYRDVEVGLLHEQLIYRIDELLRPVCGDRGRSREFTVLGSTLVEREPTPITPLPTTPLKSTPVSSMSATSPASPMPGMPGMSGMPGAAPEAEPAIGAESAFISESAAGPGPAVGPESAARREKTPRKLRQGSSLGRFMIPLFAFLLLAGGAWWYGLDKISGIFSGNPVSSPDGERAATEQPMSPATRPGSQTAATGRTEGPAPTVSSPSVSTGAGQDQAPARPSATSTGTKKKQTINTVARRLDSSRKEERAGAASRLFEYLAQGERQAGQAWYDYVEGLSAAIGKNPADFKKYDLLREAAEYEGAQANAPRAARDAVAGFAGETGRLQKELENSIFYRTGEGTKPKRWDEFSARLDTMARHGDASARFLRAVFGYSGVDRPRNREAAVLDFLALTADENVDINVRNKAQKQVAIAVQNALINGERVFLQNITPEIKKTAHRGIVSMQLLMALIYRQGGLGRVEPEKARYWYERVIETEPNGKAAEMAGAGLRSLAVQ